jgi:hypothetical protein
MQRFEELGVRVIVHEAIPAGWFLVGSFVPKSIELAEYTPVAIQFLEDVSTATKNMIVVMIDTEYHLVKKNPEYYIFDQFSRVKTLLEKPSS